MNLKIRIKILTWKILIYKIKLYGCVLDVLKSILNKHNIKAIRLLYSAICSGLVNLYNEVLEKDESSSLR